MCRLLSLLVWETFDLGRDFEVVTSSNRWQKQQESLFQKEKNLEAERGKENNSHRRGGENIHLSLSFCIHTHTPNSSLLFRTQWLLFPPPRYAYNAILFFSRSSAVRVGGSLPRFRPTRYFSPLIIENGCVPKKKKFLAPQRGVIVMMTENCARDKSARTNSPPSLSPRNFKRDN
jgi:hypothetical protein